MFYPPELVTCAGWSVLQPTHSPVRILIFLIRYIFWLFYPGSVSGVSKAAGLSIAWCVFAWWGPWCSTGSLVRWVKCVRTEEVQWKVKDRTRRTDHMWTGSLRTREVTAIDIRKGKGLFLNRKFLKVFHTALALVRVAFLMLFVIQFYDVALMTGAGDKHRYSGRHSRPHWKISFGSERSQSPRYALG